MKLSIICEDNVDVLYHCTSTDNLQSILKNGLDPQYADPNHVYDEEMNDDEYLGPPYHFIYLSPFPKLCRKFGPGGEYRPGDKNGSILLKIILPQYLKDKLVLDRGEFVRAPFIIPPECIEVVK